MGYICVNVSNASYDQCSTKDNIPVLLVLIHHVFSPSCHLSHTHVLFLVSFHAFPWSSSNLSPFLKACVKDSERERERSCLLFPALKGSVAPSPHCVLRYK